MLSTPQVFMLK